MNGLLAMTERARELLVDLPPRWLRDSDFEELVEAHDYRAHLSSGGRIVFAFPALTKIAAHTGLWLLSFLNQLALEEAGRIELKFVATSDLFGYLGRNGFLDLLSDRIETEPARPFVSGAVIFKGASPRLVEIQELRPGMSGGPRQEVVGSLVAALGQQYGTSRQTHQLQHAVFTALGELVDNVFSHSRTRVPGYAVLQAYPKAERVQIGVSDSGIGIPNSIRSARGPKVIGMSDGDIVTAAFQDGLSRHGDSGGRGCGLPTCARLAAEYRSDVIVRTPSGLVVLHPNEGDPGLTAEVREAATQLQGSHICLQFRVDRRRATAV